MRAPRRRSLIAKRRFGRTGHQSTVARFIGFTGHGWTIAAMHRRSLVRFDFDFVLLPFNFFLPA